VTASALAAAVHPSRKTVVSTAALLLVAAVIWIVRDYRLPLAAKSQILNRGKGRQRLTRLDSKGVPQVWVPPGCFEMGSNPLYDMRAHANETPRHTVCITSGFWLDRYEITNESFRQFVAEGGYEQSRYWSREGWRMHEGRRTPYPMLKDFDKPRQPRVKLTWYEAEAYAAWRGGRLPTEAQWEWAARGPESRRYPWGEKFREDFANMDHLDLRCTMPVGSYSANRSWCGAEDMAGNAWEWVADGYDAKGYRNAHINDPFIAPTGILRVIRGGAWGGVPGGGVSDLRCARRAAWPADNRKLSHGARIMHVAP